jgi:hypothetical protein
VQREEAHERLNERDAVNDAIWQLQALPPAQRTQDRRVALAQAVVATLHPEATKILAGVDVTDATTMNPDRVVPPGEVAKMQQQFVNVFKKINMGITRGTGDALTDAMLAATSTDQKVAVLQEAAKGMTEPELQTWLMRAGQNRVISPAVHGAFLARRAAQHPAAAAR